MSVVLRFVDKESFVQERFFGVIHVRDTKALTLRDNIFEVLSPHNLDVKSIRRQGYDGASNMRGEFNGLQALVSRECPQAYYVHCFAHCFQFARVAASHGVNHVHHFFNKLRSIINAASASCKRSDQLKVAHGSNVDFLLGIGELESGSSQNQIGSLQRAGNTRWSSHLKFIHSLLKMYSATCEVLLIIIDDGEIKSAKVDVESAYDDLTSTEFVFILHIKKAILELFDKLCHALQLQVQDILNAMSLVSATKKFIQKFRDEEWENLVQDVRRFCEKVPLEFPDFAAPHLGRRGKPRHQQKVNTEEECYKVQIFEAAINSQLSELNYRFNDDTLESINLSSTLDPNELRSSIRKDDICKLDQKFYPIDFDQYELRQLRP